MSVPPALDVALVGKKGKKTSSPGGGGNCVDSSWSPVVKLGNNDDKFNGPEASYSGDILIRGGGFLRLRTTLCIGAKASTDHVVAKCKEEASRYR